MGIAEAKDVAECANPKLPRHRATPSLRAKRVEPRTKSCLRPDSEVNIATLIRNIPNSDGIMKNHNSINDHHQDLPTPASLHSCNLSLCVRTDVSLSVPKAKSVHRSIR
jgi:hypothetical protein